MQYLEKDPDRSEYSSDDLMLEFVYNQRDGIDLIARSKSFGKEFSFSILMDAIDTYLGRYTEPPFDKIYDHDWIISKIESYATFLHEYYKELFILDSEMFDLCSELRFWHIGKWSKEWGKGVEMSDEDIEKAGSIVPSIIGKLKAGRGML